MIYLKSPCTQYLSLTEITPKKSLTETIQHGLGKKHIKQKKQKSDAAIEKLTNEQFALSIIDGSLLQIACKGI